MFVYVCIARNKAAISPMLDLKGCAFVLIRFLYSDGNSANITKLKIIELAVDVAPAAPLRL